MSQIQFFNFIIISIFIIPSPLLSTSILFLPLNNHFLHYFCFSFFSISELHISSPYIFLFFVSVPSCLTIPESRWTLLSCPLSFCRYPSTPTLSQGSLPCHTHRPFPHFSPSLLCFPIFNAPSSFLDSLYSFSYFFRVLYLSFVIHILAFPFPFFRSLSIFLHSVSPWLYPTYLMELRVY